MSLPPFTIEVRPGERPNEEVGVLGDGRPFLLTANLRPSSLGDDEPRLLVFIAFDQGGAPHTVDVRPLGLRSDVSSETLAEAMVNRLGELGGFTRAAIRIRPIDVDVLGPLFAPSTLSCEEEPDLRVTLNAGAILPGWPFSSDE
jgi:hypothetical protein